MCMCPVTPVVKRILPINFRLGFRYTPELQEPVHFLVSQRRCALGPELNQLSAPPRVETAESTRCMYKWRKRCTMIRKRRKFPNLGKLFLDPSATQVHRCDQKVPCHATKNKQLGPNLLIFNFGLARRLIVRSFWFLSQFDFCFEVVGSHTLNFRWLVGWLVGWLVKSLLSYAGGGFHKDGASTP